MAPVFEPQFVSLSTKKPKHTLRRKVNRPCEPQGDHMTDAELVK